MTLYSEKEDRPNFSGGEFISPGLRTKQLGLNLGWWSSAHLISLRSKLGLHEINVEKTLCSSGQSWLMGFYLLDLWIVHANLRTCVCLVWSCSFHLNMLQRVHLVERLLSLFDRQVVESDEITDNTPSVPSGTKLQSWDTYSVTEGVFSIVVIPWMYIFISGVLCTTLTVDE